MADSSFDDLNSFNCPVCLHLLKDPITTACGHSFCMNCITECWDQDDQKGVYSCPQCRQIFTPRPVLNRSTVLAELVEKMKREEPATENKPPLCSAESEDVECDVCIRTKLKAIKFCQMCVAFYCEYHIQTHYTSPALKRHKLVNASPHLLEQICTQHDKPLELYCCQKLICVQCALIDHQNHSIVSPATSRKQIEGQLRSNQENIQLERNQRENKVQELREAMDSHKESAKAAVEQSEAIFADRIRTMKRKREEITKMIKNQEEAEESVVKKHIDSLEQEISDLIKRHDELEQISEIEDDIHFIQKFSSLSQFQFSNLHNITVNQHLTFDEIQPILSELKSQLDDLCEQDTVRISEKVPTVHIMESQNVLTKYLPSQPKTREEFLIYSSLLTLNASSACYQLSVGDKSVSRKDKSTDYYYSRPIATYKVLCKEKLSGRCYFEVNWKGSGCSIGFSYDNISQGATTSFGSNKRSWRCDFTTVNVCEIQNGKTTNVQFVAKIGVFLDTEAGTLSFYNVSDKMTLLHRIQTTFTEPLYPGFSFEKWGNNSSVTIL
ncbi:finTRIM family, member 81 [Paramisgurnus dabryanus]|uniref:finTRIM family, member 81 n=1 Tax=Paramisgurnus dabryanus TaxID=90735 RepID=UPI0031F3B3DB